MPLIDGIDVVKFEMNILAYEIFCQNFVTVDEETIDAFIYS